MDVMRNPIMYNITLNGSMPYLLPRHILGDRDSIRQCMELDRQNYIFYQYCRCSYCIP